MNSVSLYARTRGYLDQMLKGGTLRAKAMRGGAFLEAEALRSKFSASPAT